MQEVHPWKFGLIMRKMREIDAIYRRGRLPGQIFRGELAIWLVLLHLEKECSPAGYPRLFSQPRQTVNSLIANPPGRRVYLPKARPKQPQPKAHLPNRKWTRLWTAEGCLDFPGGA